MGSHKVEAYVSHHPVKVAPWAAPVSITSRRGDIALWNHREILTQEIRVLVESLG